MKREEILYRLGFFVPENKKKRVIIHTDIACEADDPFAVVHHLLTPSEDIVGIVAAHFEGMYRDAEIRLAGQIKDASPEEKIALQPMIENLNQHRLHTMEHSYALGKQLLEKMEIDDVPLIKGAIDRIENEKDLPDSPGADFIISEAMKVSDRPLYIALQGGITDLAVAYLKRPEISRHIAAAIWIGGGPYPDGKGDFNMSQDIRAAEIIFQSDITLWQYPANVYAAMNISFAEIISKIRNKGDVGKFIADYMLEFNNQMSQYTGVGEFPHGEVWSIGDNPTVLALLENPSGQKYHTIPAPHISEDMSYIPNPNGHLIRVYDAIDNRLAMNDLFAKLDLCYG